MRWIDLSSIGVYLTVQESTHTPARIILLDTFGRGNGDRLRDMGFELMIDEKALDNPSTGADICYGKNFYVLSAEHRTVRPNQLAQAFGLRSCVIYEVNDMNDVRTEFEANAEVVMKSNMTRFASAATHLGKITRSIDVLKKEQARFLRVVNGEDVDIIGESEAKVAGCLVHLREEGLFLDRSSVFLRARSEQALMSCAGLFCWPLVNGSLRYEERDLWRFARILHEHEGGDEATPHQVQALQAAIEAQIVNLLANSRLGLDRTTFDRLVRIHKGTPAYRSRASGLGSLQQYSTPMPMALVAQHLLLGNADADAGATLLEPAVGHGALLSALPPGMRVFAMDVDRYRLDRMSEGIAHENLQQGDATEVSFKAVFGVEDGFDYVISNPPFGVMTESRAHDVLPNVRRLDHFIALKSLSERKDRGRAVFIVGTDMTQSEGVVGISSSSFLGYLYDNYHVHGVVEVDARLYARSGPFHNVRVVVVGNRREAPVTSDEVPTRLEVIDSHEDLWYWANSLILAYERDAEKISESDEDLDENVVPDGQVRDVAGATGDESLQTSYQPLSAVNKPHTMIPVNMAGPVYAALARLNRKHGNVDEFVARKLEYSLEDLGRLFSAEQVDAIALGIAAIDERRGMINADQTGVGKGRFLAAMMRYVRLNGKVPVFVTVRRELFSDIYRDLMDIDSEKLFSVPFILNNGTSIQKHGENAEILHAPTRTKLITKAVKEKAIPAGTDVILTTYSQLSTRVSQKAELIEAVASKGAVLLLDEAHAASGVSNTFVNLQKAVDKASAVIYASATPLKGANNFRIYRRVFPASIDVTMLEEVLNAGGEAMLEAVSTNMVCDGVLIRREHDFKNMAFVNDYPDEKSMQRNRLISDRLAEILELMCQMSAEVDREVAEMNVRLEKDAADTLGNAKAPRASSMNFGSRLQQISRQFALAIKVEDTVKAALTALKEGRKPVIALENTGETLLQWVLSNKMGDEQVRYAQELEELSQLENLSSRDKERLTELKGKLNEGLDGMVLSSLPQFRELLSRILDRMDLVTVRHRHGKQVHQKVTSPSYFRMKGEALKLIGTFPDLALAPLDSIRNKLLSHGYRIGEVSGRGLMLEQEHEKGNTWRVRSTADKEETGITVAKFQNGTYQAIIITKAGSTGISLHASNRFENSDPRQRDFLMPQKASNIVEYLQWLGRVNRKDQIIAPIIRCIESGLPAESRVAMMHNEKLRQLSANTTSNRDNLNMDRDTPDLLNSVGEAVARSFLYENSSIATRLDLSVNSKDLLPFDSITRRTGNNDLINKLLARAVLLNVEEQEEVFSALKDRFEHVVSIMNEKGENPFRVELHDWRAKVDPEDETLQTTLTQSGSSFDRPVIVRTIRFEEDRKPIRIAEVMKRAENSARALDRIRGEEGHDVVQKLLKMLDASLRGYLQDLSKDPASMRRSEEEMLRHDAQSGLQEAHRRYLFLKDVLPLLQPGVMLSLQGDLAEDMVKGILVGVSFPRERKGGIFHPANYYLRVAVPGEEKLRTLSLEDVHKMPFYNISKHNFLTAPTRSASGLKDAEMAAWMSEKAMMAKAFDEAEGGRVTRIRHVLEGNVFRAMEMALKGRYGTPILYTDDKGKRHRAVLLKDEKSLEKVKNYPLSMTSEQVKDYTVRWIDRKLGLRRRSVGDPRNHGTLVIDSVNQQEYREGVRIAITVAIGGKVSASLTVPGMKSRQGYSVMADGAIVDKQNDDGESLKIKLAGVPRYYLTGPVDVRSVPLLVDRLVANGHVSEFLVGKVDREIIREMSVAYEQKQRSLANDRERDDTEIAQGPELTLF